MEVEGNSFGVVYFYHLTGAGAEVGQQPCTGGSPVVCEATGLHAGSAYEMKVRACVALNVSVCGGYSVPLVTRTTPASESTLITFAFIVRVTLAQL